MSINKATKKQIATLALKTAIKKHDWGRLFDIVSMSAKQGCSKVLIKKGWVELGNHLLEGKDYVNAILAFNSARTLGLFDKKVLDKFIHGLNEFYKIFRQKFSREDLIVFNDTLARLINFYRLHKDRGLDYATEEGQNLVRKVEQQIEVAPSKVETQATFKVKQICDALYSNMTTEEVRAEFAKIVAPLIRDEYEKRVKEKSKQKKRKNVKPPK